MLERLGFKLQSNPLISAILFVLCLTFVYLTREIIMLVFISYIFMSALLPFTKTLQKNKFPRYLTVLIPFFTFIALILVLVVPVVPFFTSQIHSLFVKFPLYAHRAGNVLGIDVFSTFIGPEVAAIGGNAVRVTSRAFGGLLSLVTIFVITFYLLLDDERIKKTITRLFPQKDEKKIITAYSQIEDRLGAWLSGQLILSFSMSLIIWIVLTLLGVDFALPLAVIAGLLEFVPTLGPIMASIPAIIVGFTVSPSLALIIAGAYGVIQFLETHVLVPNIMRKAVGLHPIIVILSIVTGGRLLGVLGALLAVPFVSVIVTIWNNFTQESN